MKRIVLAVAVAVAVVGAFPAAASASSTVFSVPLNTSLTLSSGEKVTVIGNLDVAISQFQVHDSRIVATATLNGSLTGTIGDETVTATFTNTQVVLRISNLQASCDPGTLSFDFRVVVPTSGIAVTVNGEPVSLKGPIKLSGTVSVSTAAISDPATAGRVGAIICRVDALLDRGGSLDPIVRQLNALLNALS